MKYAASFAGLSAALLLLGAPRGVSAQYAAEVSGGLAFGYHTSTLAGLEREAEMSFSALLLRESFLASELGLFAGYARTAFGCRAAYCKRLDPTISGHHGVLGVEWSPALAMYLRVGAMVGTVQVGKKGDAPELGIGALIGTGFGLALDQVEFRPGVSYRWMKADTPSLAGSAGAIVAEMAFRYSLLR